MNKLIAPLGILILVLLVVAGSALFVIDETEQVIVTQFGKPVGEPIATPGLHVKLPLIQKVHGFERRFIEWDGAANQLPTRDKRFIWVDTYARWRIHDPLLYFQRVRDEWGAQSRLDDILDGETRNAIAAHDLVELVRNTNRVPVRADEFDEGESVQFPSIELGREKIKKEILLAAAARTKDLGIEILDLQFKRINYVDEVKLKVYERMIAERTRIADRFRSEGQGEASKILGQKSQELSRIQSNARREAEEIRGRADAEATEIYADAYDRSVESRKFYEFLKTMEAYQKTMDESTTALLSSDGDFYRYLSTDKTP
ncbi:MAG: HflC protein [Gemmatimonadetes bacterium]|nr:HflC protein [Gemmatimonadota bacterium]